LQVVAETDNGIEAEYWVGIFTPAGMSEEGVARMSDIFRRASAMSGEQLKKVGLRPAWKSAAYLGRIHVREWELWRSELERLGMKP
jgi:tripartite-type tricarboxylate transporter receptor subunit TctC